MNKKIRIVHTDKEKITFKKWQAVQYYSGTTSITIREWKLPDGSLGDLSVHITAYNIGKLNADSISRERLEIAELICRSVNYCLENNIFKDELKLTKGK